VGPQAGIAIGVWLVERVRVWLPPPQGLLQADHEDQDVWMHGLGHWCVLQDLRSLVAGQA
jgi:hypothetical protein